ncbi:MAG: nucleoside 2-deoxyribosyltransferase [Chloroflexi bacterium]|nr:nucleoside 2-deoxyribosyltransferase [Chloroflexota bacterium]
MKKIYVAGPLFTSNERDLLESIDKVCQDCGYTTYLPHRDAGVFSSDDDSSLTFFQKDLSQLDESSMVVAVLNGFDVDSGTSWEIGYFFAKAKGNPVIGYVDDSRIFDSQKQINLMILNSLTMLTKTLPELQDAIEKLNKG